MDSKLITKSSYTDVAEELVLFYNAVKENPKSQNLSEEEVCYLFPALYLALHIKNNRLGSYPLSTIAMSVKSAFIESHKHDRPLLLCVVNHTLLLNELASRGIYRDDILESSTAEEITSQILSQESDISTVIQFANTHDETYFQNECDRLDGDSIEAMKELHGFRRSMFFGSDILREKELMAKTVVDALLRDGQWFDYVRKYTVSASSLPIQRKKSPFLYLLFISVLLVILFLFFIIKTH